MFLNGCKEYGMSEKDLFVTLDLHEQQNTTMVICYVEDCNVITILSCLSALYVGHSHSLLPWEASPKEEFSRSSHWPQGGRKKPKRILRAGST